LSTPQDPFDALLAWLSSDREIAARKYETIRAGLIRTFIAKGRSNAEDLADVVISRVSKRVPEISDGYVGEPARYFHGVLRNVLRETYDLKEIATDDLEIAWIPTTAQSDLYECLLRCLQFLSPEKSDLALDYYLYTGHDKIEHHRTMAAELSISEGALRGRAYQIRTKLEKCALDCEQSLTNAKRKESRQA
jgi:hypothetical protein